MVNPRQFVRALLMALGLSLFFAASVSAAYAQDFTLTPTAFHPAAVDPGVPARAIIILGATDGFDSPVALSCAVTSNQVTITLPTCLISPQSQTPPANGPSLTVTTFDTTAPGLYNVSVTGTSGSLTHTVTLALNVVNITENYTLSVSPTTATPSPVGAGSSSTTIVTVSPIGSYGNGSGHQVTLACLAVAPVVVAAPVCSFNPPTVFVNGGPAPTTTMTITTLGPVPTTSLWNRRLVYALWLAIPGLALVGVGASGTRRKNILGAFLLVALAGVLLLAPACSTTNNTNNPSGDTTPANTYTFTLTASDENGAAPSNGTCTTNCTTNPATVSLAVTAAN